MGPLACPLMCQYPVQDFPILCKIVYSCTQWVSQKSVNICEKYKDGEKPDHAVALANYQEHILFIALQYSLYDHDEVTIC